MINCLLINPGLKLRKKWLPPMARKGALIPRTSSSLIPANPGTAVLSSLFNILVVSSENMMLVGNSFQTWEYFPLTGHLLHPLLFAELKEEVFKPDSWIHFQSQTCSPKLCEIECEAISWPSGELLRDFLSDTGLRISQSRCLNISSRSGLRVSQWERQGVFLVFMSSHLSRDSVRGRSPSTRGWHRRLPQLGTRSGSSDLDGRFPEVYKNHAFCKIM